MMTNRLHKMACWVAPRLGSYRTELQWRGSLVAKWICYVIASAFVVTSVKSIAQKFATTVLSVRLVLKPNILHFFLMKHTREQHTSPTNWLNFTKQRNTCRKDVLNKIEIYCVVFLWVIKSKLQKLQKKLVLYWKTQFFDHVLKSEDQNSHHKWRVTHL